MDRESLDMLEAALRKTMLSASGPELDAALAELGWADMLSAMPDVAVPLVFRLLGETGAHASVLVDVVLHATGNTIGDTVELPLPYAGNAWVVWDRISPETAEPTLGGLPLRREEEGYPIRLAEARVAVGWWLVGSARAMLTLARRHALDRVQFGTPIAGFQAIRHRLAETLVAIEGAEATLSLPAVDNPDLIALLAKAAAGKAALTAAKNCQQVLGGIGFTAEHELHRHVERILVLDGLLGSSRELTRRAGAGLRARGSAPRLANL
ncbi:acyl-CoA dehydrogenase family protein [Mycolicibacterium rufum]|uniref:Acyl-CoA dehydrogenase n=1 Tax=Mycolicibacterium rufum TaxID=318424 RepID=A0A9X3BS41_9MYCO|nr:acyl-CoA dehydrogenase family protein [Mycolicibacterium rufum]KGI71030.1 acyl-CoA dehydrogenase [Mycolicibacterium rufum]MCV7072970.1 acyl-CoA dehydrogenase [Mycolicibacterium rufum]ULP39630.1 acyl-CoA dehydrogenase family protein [Mycolicibacterium rufum]